MRKLVNYREVNRRIELDGIEATLDHLSDALETKALRADDFSIRDLAEAVIPDGREFVQKCNPKLGAGGGFSSVVEAGAVQSSNFTNITGQIVYSKLMESYENPAFIGDQLCSTIQTDFSGEKVPGVAGIGDEAEIVGEGREYPLAAFGEDYVETPPTLKRGFIVPITREAIFFDRTGLVLKRAAELGYYFGVNREKRIIDVATGITSSYKWKGTSYSTYVDTPWDNLAASNGLTDWRNVEAVELLFDGLTDPNTGEPIMNTGNTVLIPSALKHTAGIIFGGIVEKVDMQANAVTYRTMAGTNPIGNDYNIISSPMVKARTSSASTWFMGDFKKAFAYMQNWPMTVTQAPANSEAEFMQDIVARYKVSERGAAAVWDPRYVVKCTA